MAQVTFLDLVRGGLPPITALLVLALAWAVRELRAESKLRVEAAERYAESQRTLQTAHAETLTTLRNSHAADIKAMQEANSRELSRVHEARVEEMQQVTRAADAITELTQLLRERLEPPNNIRGGKR